MRVDFLLRPLEKFRVVRPKKNRRSRARPRRPIAQSFFLNYPIFVMPLLRPRIQKKQKKLFQSDFRRQRFKKFRRFRLKKFDVPEAAKRFFSLRALDSFRNQIETNTSLARERRRVSRQKMPVPATDFQSQPAIRKTAQNLLGNERRDFFSKRLHPRRLLGTSLFVIAHNSEFSRGNGR